MSTRTRRLARFSLRLAQIGGVVFLLAPLVYRLGVGLGPAFAMLALGVLACVVALVVASGTWLFSRRGPDVVPPARAAVIVALMVLVAPVWSVANGRGAPPIHHVTTDPADPPQFEAVIPLRGETSNAIDYSDELAVIQREAYPDLEPVFLSASPSEAFDQAMEVATALGWEIVAASEDDGRFEATDTTFWFGFKDDVVVRIRPEGDGSRIDLRSVSRVGVGDLGANAARIKRFVQRIEP